MIFFSILVWQLLLLAGPCQVLAKSAFAHFMVGNCQTYTLAEWQNEMALAKAAHLDAFALNMAAGEAGPLALAFQAANNVGFKLFFSFDYGPSKWAASDVTNLIQQYKGNGAYFKYNNQPFVSTFEGTDNAQDWVAIKSTTGCFFVPDWSSLGAKKAVALKIANGLFNWGAWPYGANDGLNVVDASYYLDFAKGMPYMMPISPWFFTNMPGYTKNWAWRGDDLWHDRWQIVMTTQPEFIQIISWNDFGESHYIGPLVEKAFGAFAADKGRPPFNYVRNMPHDKWRLFLPFLIDMYKNGVATITQEGVMAWYRLNSNKACESGGTTGNTISQQQCETDPANVLQDKVFFSALLTSAATVSVSIGGVSQAATWRNVPYGNVGVFHGSVPFNGRTGTVVVTVSKSGGTISMSGQAISGTCANGIQNWNPWVGGTLGGSIAAVTTPKKFSDLKCIEGTGVGGKVGLCSFSCHYNYCPPEACTCLAMGDQVKEPTALNVNGYPIAALDVSYSGLCSYACNRGYCPPTACSTTKVALSLPPQEGPFPVCWKQVCVKGTGPGNILGLCDFSCYFGFCPSVCTCTAQGPQNALPATVNVKGWAISGDDGGLCDFTCSHGYCPDTACRTSGGILFELPAPGEVTDNKWCSEVEGEEDDYDREGDAWRQSDAGHILDQIVDRDGARDIDDTLNKYSGLSVTNCGNAVDASNCVMGGAKCPADWDIRIAYHYIQKAFVNYHALLNGLHTSLVASTLLTIIEIQSLIDDIALELVEPFGKKSDALTIIAGVFGTASSALGLIPSKPIFGAVSGIMGGAVGFAQVIEGDEEEEEGDYLKETASFLSKRLANTFRSMQKALASAGDAVFNTGDFSKFLPSALFFNQGREENYAYKTDMARYFADGRYVFPIPDFTPFQENLEKYIKYSLISGLMTSALIYITVDAFDLISCSMNDGYLYDFDGIDRCYTLERPTRAGADRIKEGIQREWVSVPLGRRTFSYDILQLKYGLNDINIFQGSYDCQKAKNDYGGIYDFSDTVPTGDSHFSLCFWNLPIIYVHRETGYAQDSTPCWMMDHTITKEAGGKVGIDYLPEPLAKRFLETDGYCP